VPATAVGGGDSVLGRLRREVDALKRKLHAAEREWNEVSWHLKNDEREKNSHIADKVTNGRLYSGKTHD
jgi:hypothetical protein